MVYALDTYPDKKIAKSNFVVFGVLGSVFDTCLKKLFWVVSFPALVQACLLHSIDPSMSDYPDLSQNLSKQNQNKMSIKFGFSYFFTYMDQIWIKFRLDLDKVFFFKISLGSPCA